MEPRHILDLALEAVNAAGQGECSVLITQRMVACASDDKLQFDILALHSLQARPEEEAIYVGVYRAEQYASSSQVMHSTLQAYMQSK